MSLNSDELIIYCSDLEDEDGDNTSNISHIDGDDEDEDDGINVIIGNPKELGRIDNLIKSSDVYSLYSNDLAIQSELRDLVRKSINPKSTKFITVKVQNQTILIPNDVPISSRLASLLWAKAKEYCRMTLPSQDEFNKNMVETRKVCGVYNATYPGDVPISNKIGIFSMKYKKNILAQDVALSVAASTSSSANNSSVNIYDTEGFKHCSSGIYQYCDFAVLIIENGEVIDYAIHGYSSNINECIKRHNPEKIFYNANVGDAFDVFMKYPYQPFYEATSGRAFPLKIHRLQENFNSISFCERNDVYCALCLGLKDLRALLFRIPQQPLVNDKGEKLRCIEAQNRHNRTERYDRRHSNHHRQHHYYQRNSSLGWRPRFSSKSTFGKNLYGQPTHNAFRIRLSKVSKLHNQRFRPYD